MSARRAWARFGRLGHTWGLAPGAREAWHRGRRWYHVWVLRVDDAAVRARRAAVWETMAGWLEPSAPDDPHVTVWVHGFDPPGFHHPLEGAEVPLRVGGAGSFASCPYLEVRGPLDPLRRAFPGGEERWAPYLPHLTVGRYAGAVPVAPVVRALRPLRRLPPLDTRGRLCHVVVDALDPAGGLQDPRAVGALP